VVARFNRAAGRVTTFGLVPAMTPARSASEGPGYLRLRFGLMCASTEAAVSRDPRERFGLACPLSRPVLNRHARHASAEVLIMRWHLSTWETSHKSAKPCFILNHASYTRSEVARQPA
jgi:hypothetical protein